MAKFINPAKVAPCNFEQDADYLHAVTATAGSVMKHPLAAFLASTSLAALIVFLAMWAAFRDAFWPHSYYPVIFVFAADAMWKLSMLKARDIRWHWLGLLAASGLAFALFYLGFGADLGFCMSMLLTYLLFRGFMIMTT